MGSATGGCWPPSESERVIYIYREKGKLDSALQSTQPPRLQWCAFGSFYTRSDIHSSRHRDRVNTRGDAAFNLSARCTINRGPQHFLNDRRPVRRVHGHPTHEHETRTIRVSIFNPSNSYRGGVRLPGPRPGNFPNVSLERKNRMPCVRVANQGRSLDPARSKGVSVRSYVRTGCRVSQRAPFDRVSRKVSRVTFARYANAAPSNCIENEIPRLENREISIPAEIFARNRTDPWSDTIGRLRPSKRGEV